MRKPAKLQNGDLVHVVFPASPVRPEFFEKGMEAVRGLGLRVTHGEPYRKWRYMAGNDAERRVEFAEALRDPGSKAIFFARGGYGCARLLTDNSGFDGSLAPKILLGCSDITTLHLYFGLVHDWVVFHGPMASGDFSRGQAHVDSLKLALMQTAPYTLAPENLDVLQPGDADGVLSGGCLTLLEAALGTAWEPDWNGAILFLEDVDSKPYQIDRMLTHLKTAGKFDGVRAFVFGEMKSCVQVQNQSYTLQEVILDILGPLGKPIYYNFPSGHVSGLNWTLPLGVRVRVSAAPHFHLDILEGAVL
jgi:muramoyltetrapeptide carboxypeptidase